MRGKIEAAIAANVRALPAISGGVGRVLELLRDPDADISEIEKELRSDPGLTANLLKISNAPYFGFPGTVASVRDAVMKLGMKRVAQLVIAAATNSVLGDAIPGYDSEPRELWLHSIATSVAAEKIAIELGFSEQESEEVFTAALLHDVGKIVLGSFVKRKAKKFASIMSTCRSFDAAERDILGVDHAEIGARILEQWSLPQRLISAARLHHRPQTLDPPDRVVDVVHVADLVSMSLGYDEGREGLQYEVSPEVLKRLGLSRDQLELVALHTLEGVEELSGAVGIAEQEQV